MIYSLVKKVLPALFFLLVLNVNAQVQLSSGSLKIVLDNRDLPIELKD